MANTEKRFVALDLHKQYVMVGAVNKAQEMRLPPRKVRLVALEGWAKKHLRPTDEVVLEATTNAWYVYDLLEPLVERVVVCHPPHVKLTPALALRCKCCRSCGQDRQKRHHDPGQAAGGGADPGGVGATPPRPGTASAHQPPPALDLPPDPPHTVLADCARENQLRSLLQRHHIVPPEGDSFSEANRAWWSQLELSPSEKLRARQDLVMLDQLGPLLVEIENELNRLSLNEPWAEQMPYLLQLPGIGLLTALTILGAIGEIERFPTAKKLVGYAGLGARVHASGQTHRSGDTQSAK
jgi:hypothetical protein